MKYNEKGDDDVLTTIAMEESVEVGKLTSAEEPSRVQTQTQGVVPPSYSEKNQKNNTSTITGGRYYKTHQQSNDDKSSPSSSVSSKSAPSKRCATDTGFAMREPRIYDENRCDQSGDEELHPDDVEDHQTEDIDGGSLKPPSTLFSETKGNLHFVNLVVRFPCLVFFAILILSLVLSVLLIGGVIRSGENPFADPSLEYDVNDVRSIAYDSLKLARVDVLEQRSGNALSSGANRNRRLDSRSFSWSRLLQDTTVVEDEVRTQEESLDSIFWAFESETADQNLFGSAESIKAMKIGLDLFLEHHDYGRYCRRIYVDGFGSGFLDSSLGVGRQDDYAGNINVDRNVSDLAGGNLTDFNQEFSFSWSEGEGASAEATAPVSSSFSFCMPPLTALNMYYASEWDSSGVNDVMSHLQSQENIARYNDLALCIESGLYCDQISSQYNNPVDIQWATDLHRNISLISSKWDLRGDLHENLIDEITTFAANLLELDTKRGLVEFGFDADFSRSHLKSKYSRLIVMWGGPLNNVTTTPKLSSPDEDVDRAKLKAYVVKEFLTDLEAISQPDYSDQLNSYYFMGVLILEVLLQIVQRDAMLAIISFVFVFLYIRISVGSWFLAFVGMLEIVLSVPISWFIFSVCFQIKYFSFLNALCLFIVAAIGADDIFIFMDAYKQSAHNKEEPEILNSLEARMSWVYRRTGSAMFITSATTCSAFLCTLITPLAGVRAFGVFAATVILVDYILVMTLFCTAVVIYHNKFENKSCIGACCCCCDGRGEDESGGCCANTNPSPTDKAKQAMSEGNDKHSEDAISRFFRTKVASFILNRWARIGLGAAFVAWVITATVFAFRIEATQESEQFLNEDHPLQKSFSIFGTAFNKAESDDGEIIHFTWGLGEVNRDGVNQLLDPTFFGTPTFLDQFAFTEQCQAELLNVCDDLKTNSKYDPYIKQVNGLGSVSCFVEEFGAFSALGTLDDCDVVRSGSWKNSDWRVPLEDVPALMRDFLDEISCYSDTRGSILSHYTHGLGWNGSDLKYVGISLESSVLSPYGRQSERVVREQYDAMISIAKEMDSTMTAFCSQDSNVMMTDLNEKFIFMNNQAIYVQSAWQSALLGVCIAFVVLLLSTQVLHIALFATVSIICVLVSVSGVMVMIGWQLGSIEAILIAIVAGFSVDYVVHLAHAYERASGNKVSERLRAAFGEMGISVLNGMMTSVGASVPLFFCQLQFFRKFGTFLCLTIAFSWVFANFAFMSILATFRIPIKHKGWNC